MVGLNDGTGSRIGDDRVGGSSRSRPPIAIVDVVADVEATAAAAFAGLLCVILVLKDAMIHRVNSTDGGKHARGQAGIVADVCARAFALVTAAALATLAALEVSLLMLSSLGGLADCSSIRTCTATSSSRRLDQG